MRGFQTLRHSWGIFSNYLKVSQYKWSFDHKGIDQRYPKLSVKVIPIIVSIFLTVTWLTSDVLNVGIDMPRYLNFDDIIIHPYSIELQKHWLSGVIEMRNSIYSDHNYMCSTDAIDISSNDLTNIYFIVENSQ